MIGEEEGKPIQQDSGTNGLIANLMCIDKREYVKLKIFMWRMKQPTLSGGF